MQEICFHYKGPSLIFRLFGLFSVFHSVAGIVKPIGNGESQEERHVKAVEAGEHVAGRSVSRDDLPFIGVEGLQSADRSRRHAGALPVPAAIAMASTLKMPQEPISDTIRLKKMEPKTVPQM
jgi:hypothetical protein